MFWMVLYAIVSIIMSVVLSSVTFKVTDLSNFGLCTKTLFLIYFAIGNLLAWPVFMLFSASAYLHDELDI